MTNIMKYNLDVILVEAFKSTNTVCARQPRATICYPTHYDLTVQEELEASLSELMAEWERHDTNRGVFIDAEWDEIETQLTSLFNRLEDDTFPY